MRKTILALSLALSTTACLTTGPTEVAVGAEFELAPNQTARIIGTNWTIGFRGVTSDTRCPLDRLCLVAGDAGIQLDVFGSSADSPIILSPTPPNDRWADQQFRVRVIDLSPTPSGDRMISPGEYRVRLVVEPAGS